MNTLPRFFVFIFSLLFFTFSANAQEEPLPKKGHYVSRYKDGKLRMEGDVKNHRRTGLWKSYSVDGRLMKTETYLNGSYHGYVVEYFAGTVDAKFIHHYQNGKQEGWQYEYTLLRPNTQLSEKAFYRNDTMTCRYRYSDGRLRNVECCRDGKLSGTCRYYNTWPHVSYRDSAAMSTIEYADGLYHGANRVYSNGTLTKETYYAYGKQEGYTREWRYDGKLLKEEQYSDGMLQGKSTNYFLYYTQPGQIARRSTYYSHGKKSGPETACDVNGDTMSICWLYLDKLDSGRLYDAKKRLTFFTKNAGDARDPQRCFTIAYDSLGRITEQYFCYASTGYYAAYFRHVGDSWTYYPNGQLHTKEKWLGGSLDSLYTVWYPNGKKLMQADFSGGLLAKAPLIWNEKGQALQKGSTVYNKLFYEQDKYPFSIDRRRYDPGSDGILLPGGKNELVDDRVMEVVQDGDDSYRNSPGDFPSYKKESAGIAAIKQPDQPAFFPGSPTAWEDFLLGHTYYPNLGKKKKSSGDVVLSFTVGGEGYLEDIKVLSEVNGYPEFTTEALRVLNASPRWVPAKNKGKFVKMPMTVTIHFEPGMALQQ